MKNLSIRTKFIVLSILIIIVMVCLGVTASVKSQQILDDYDQAMLYAKQQEKLLSMVAEALQTYLAEFSDRVEVEDRLALRASARQLKRYAYYLHPSQVDEQPAAVFYLDLGRLTGEQAAGIAVHINQIVSKHFRLTPSLALAEGKFTARVAARKTLAVAGPANSECTVPTRRLRSSWRYCSSVISSLARQV